MITPDKKTKKKNIITALAILAFMVFLFVFIEIYFAFLTSTLSATALMGRFFGFKFLIIIFDLSLIILPFHLLGLKGLIGLIANFLLSILNIGPWTDKL